MSVTLFTPEGTCRVERPLEPQQDVDGSVASSPGGQQAQEVRREGRQILCAGEKVMLFLAPTAAQGGEACGRQTRLGEVEAKEDKIQGYTAL